MTRRGDGSINGGPYRAMKQEEIRIPRRPTHWPYYVVIASIAAGIGGVLDNHYAKTRTVIVTKEVEKVVTKVVDAPPPVCVDKVFVMKHFTQIHCDNSNHVLQYKPGDEAAVCRCKTKD
eukprot:gnl/Spiro4/4613_TR2305_c1_g1_i1.p7 gnl/Spiro4/4613_TR2305_c1_g1~~gnl/Spiro4/4613_TR2305_c1_g1_i1.p7  ORF type:complete len:119 (+),score=3.72 gnl/Spiro4/4613_TR2305_c1_g1_i1:9272-9628(+)